MIVKSAREYDYNPETDGPCQTRSVRFTVRDQAFSFDVDVPFYIVDKLSENDWQRIMHTIEGRALEALRVAWENRSLFRDGRAAVDAKILKDLKQQIYERFLDAQEREGNSAWSAPSTLDKVATESELAQSYDGN